MWKNLKKKRGKKSPAKSLYTLKIGNNRIECTDRAYSWWLWLLPLVQSKQFISRSVASNPENWTSCFIQFLAGFRTRCWLLKSTQGNWTKFAISTKSLKTPHFVKWDILRSNSRKQIQMSRIVEIASIPMHFSQRLRFVFKKRDTMELWIFGMSVKSCGLFKLAQKESRPHPKKYVYLRSYTINGLIVIL